MIMDDDTQQFEIYAAPVKKRNVSAYRHLTADQALDICKYALAAVSPEPYSALEKRFNTSETTLRRVLRGEHPKLDDAWRERMGSWFVRNTDRRGIRPGCIANSGLDPQKTVPLDVVVLLAQFCVLTYGANESFLRRFLRTSANIELPRLDQGDVDA